MNITLVRQAIITYVHEILSTNPDYAIPFASTNDVYWADTKILRPVDATECCLSVVRDESLVWGIDGEIVKIPYTDPTTHVVTDKYYTKQLDPHILTINISVSSMRNDANKISDLQAQNLAIGACSYIKNNLKSTQVSSQVKKEALIAQGLNNNRLNRQKVLGIKLPTTNAVLSALALGI